MLRNPSASDVLPAACGDRYSRSRRSRWATDRGRRTVGGVGGSGRSPRLGQRSRTWRGRGRAWRASRAGVKSRAIAYGTGGNDSERRRSSRPSCRSVCLECAAHRFFQHHRRSRMARASRSSSTRCPCAFTSRRRRRLVGLPPLYVPSQDLSPRADVAARRPLVRGDRARGRAQSDGRVVRARPLSLR